VGLVSRLGGGSCPKSVASWARVSALKDEICGVAGCANDSNADSSGERGLCRWTALKVHAILFFILCAGFVPASLIIQTGVYELARKPDKSVDVQYLKEYSPTLDYVVLGIEGVGVLGFLIPAIIVVAVGVAPNNGKYAHSIIGYLLLALIIAQIILTLVLRKYGHAKQWKDPSNPKYTVYRVKHFNGFAIYLLLLYIETPIGILRIGYGAGAFFGWFAYLAFLHLLHFIWVKTAQCASLSKKVHPAKEVVDEELEAPPPSQKYRSKSVSPSRRVSLQDHHKPWFVKDDHVQKEERSQKRRETIANQLRRKSQTNLFSQVADAVQRRRSFSEGLSEVFSDRPKLESERLSMARATGGERRASQRVSTYEGPRDTGNTAVQESTQRMGSRRASMRRGSVSNMNY